MSVGENVLKLNLCGIRIGSVDLVAGAGVGDIPGKSGPVGAKRPGGIVAFREFCQVALRNRGNHPGVGRIGQRQIGGTALEVVEVHRSTFIAALVDGFVVARLQHGYLRLRRNTGWFFGVDQWNFIHQFGQPGCIFRNAEVQAVHFIVDGVVAEVDLLGKRALKQVHIRGADINVFA